VKQVAQSSCLGDRSSFKLNNGKLSSRTFIVPQFAVQAKATYIACLFRKHSILSWIEIPQNYVFIERNLVFIIGFNLLIGLLVVFVRMTKIGCG